MGGVINIITRKVGNEWVGSATVNGTPQGNGDRCDNHGANVYLTGPIKQDLLGLTVRSSTFHREARRLSPQGTRATPSSARVARAR